MSKSTWATLKAEDVTVLTQQDARGISVGDVVEHRRRLGIVRGLDRRNRTLKTEFLPGYTRSRFDKAVRGFRDFTGMDPAHVEMVPGYEKPDVAFQVGPLLGVIYEAVRDGEREQYIHRFKKKARPLLASSPDGKQLYMLGGAYRFTERGIVDE